MCPYYIKSIDRPKGNEENWRQPANNPAAIVTLWQAFKQTRTNNRLHFNPSKCCYIRLSNKQHLDYNYNIHNTVLQETNTIKYLGVHIDDKLTWKSHVDTIVAKAKC